MNRPNNGDNDTVDLQYRFDEGVVQEETDVSLVCHNVVDCSTSCNWLCITPRHERKL